MPNDSMMNDELGGKSLEIMDRAAAELSKLGFNNVTVSEIFFAYGLRIGALTVGASVFNDARKVIDVMEKQSLS